MRDEFGYRGCNCSRQRKVRTTMGNISYQGRVVIVTGAGGGLGREYALEIARLGGAVVVNDNGADCCGIGPGPEVADSVTAEITAAGGKAVANHEDVGDRVAAQRIADTALSKFGRIDALINNAGNLRNDWFEDVSIEDRDSVMSAHLLGNFNVAQAVWPHMKQAKYGRVRQ
jgi:NAD(P)-dependent dehydrogenase (short-subunit alcohol dehydrogenase family)